MSVNPLVQQRGRPRSFDRNKALERALGVFWQRGFAPASIADLCAAMEIKPPSLYAAFGNKEQLFMEAVDYYERTYWDETWDRMVTEPDVFEAISAFFHAAANILTMQEAPCSCMVVLSAINVPAESGGVADALRAMREEGRSCFVDRVREGVAAGQLSAATDAEAVGMTLNTILEGMSIQARDGATRADLEKIAACSVAVLGRR